MPTPRTPTNQRQRTWRAQAAQPEQLARRRRFFRIVLPVIGVGLLGLLAWVIIAWLNRPPKLDLIAVAVADYRNPEAPPIAYCYEDIEGLKKALDLGNAKSSSLWNGSRGEGIAELRTTIRETSNSHDNVLIYIKAHGVSLRGEAYLLGGDFELRVADAGRLSIARLLNDVADSPARIKLLVLDTGHLESDPRMGMIANEFTYLLTKAVAGMPAEKNLWVLTSNSLFERAQVSLADRRSAFGYYLAEGLRGAADGVAAQNAPDRLVQLDELYKYVRERVIQYALVSSSNKQSQTPLLLRAGQGEVSDISQIPHDVLLRIESADASDQKDAVALNASQSRQATAFSLRSPLALALAGNQDTRAAADPPAAKTGDAKQNDSPTATAQSGDGAAKRETSRKDNGGAADASAAKDAESATGDPSTAKDGGPAAVKEASKSPTKEQAKTAPLESAAKTPPRPRSDVEKKLFTAEKWFEDQQKREDAWRPVDYAPELARLYVASLAGCRQRILAGSLFLNVPDYQVFLQSKLSELSELKRQIEKRRDSFQEGIAHVSYERDDEVRNAIRLRNDVCHLLPLLIAHYGLTSAYTTTTLQADLDALIVEAFKLNEILARSLDQRQPDASQTFERWQQELRESAAQVSAQVTKLRGEYKARCDAQKQLASEGNPAVIRLLADLAQNPLATPERSEELQALAERSARPIANIQKPESALRGPSATDQLRLSDLGWQRVLARVELEMNLLEPLTSLLGPPDHRALIDTRKLLAAAGGSANVEQRMALLRKINDLTYSMYQRLPDQVGKQLTSSDYQTWRAAETAIRFADERDQRRIGKVLGESGSRKWSDPIAGVPLEALPAHERSYNLVVGDRLSGSPNSAFSLAYGISKKLTLRIGSSESLPDRVRLKLDYDSRRVGISSQGSNVPPQRPFPFALAANGQSREQTLDLEVRSLDQKGGTSKLTVAWLDDNDHELAQATAVLSHPEPQFAQLAVFGQRGTAEGDWRDAPQGGSYLDVPFNEGIAHVRLLTYSSHETSYDFRLTNNAGHPKKYTAVVYAVPPADDANESTRSPESLAVSAERQGKELARNDIPLAPGRVASIPFFPAPPAAAAGKEAPPPPDAAKAEDGAKGGAAAKDPPTDITNGLVCILTEDTKSADGREAVKPRRQVIVVETETQSPERYITPVVRYDADEGEITAEVYVRDDELDRLPAKGSKVEMDVITRAQTTQKPRAKRETTLTREHREDTLSAFVKRGDSARAKVHLHVDGYPRAFIYEFPLDASLPKAVRKSLNLREIALPEVPPFRVFYPAYVPDPVPFQFSVDMPQLRDRTHVARLFIDRQPGQPDDVFDRREDRLIMESFEDRVHKVGLIKPKTAAAGIVVLSQVSDFVAMLDLTPYRNTAGQQVHVRAQLVKRDSQGGETILGTRDDPADQTIVLYLDGKPPQLTFKAPTHAVYENDPFSIEIDASDEVSGVKQVDWALKVQPKPGSNDPDEFVLVEPARVTRLPGGAFRLTHAFEKAGPQSLWFQATDNSGNKSEPEKITVSVSKLPSVTDKGAPPPGAKLGGIKGRAKLPDGVGGQITKVTLSRGETVIRTADKPPGGRFEFDKLQPGDYVLKAEGTIAGNFGKPVPIPVTVEPGKPVEGIEVTLGR